MGASFVPRPTGPNGKQAISNQSLSAQEFAPKTAVVGGVQVVLRYAAKMTGACQLDKHFVGAARNLTSRSRPLE
jgi:hypothetical protein